MEDAAMEDAPGGGAEAHARSTQYDYAANSNLVVTTAPRDTHHQPTGQPETLRGRIRARSFGDRALKTRPPELEQTPGRKNARGATDLPRCDTKRARRPAGEVGVLSLAQNAAYEPRTKEMRAAYEALLGIIQQQLGGQPPDVLCDAADEVLAALKSDRTRDPNRRKEIEKLINPISDQMFDLLVSVGKLITDFHGAPSTDGTDMTLDDDIGVAVDFEEDDDDRDGNFYQAHGKGSLARQRSLCRAQAHGKAKVHGKGTNAHGKEKFARQIALCRAKHTAKPRRTAKGPTLSTRPAAPPQPETHTRPHTLPAAAAAYHARRLLAQPANAPLLPPTRAPLPGAPPPPRFPPHAAPPCPRLPSRRLALPPHGPPRRRACPRTPVAVAAAACPPHACRLRVALPPTRPSPPPPRRLFPATTAPAHLLAVPAPAVLPASSGPPVVPPPPPLRAGPSSRLGDAPASSSHLAAPRGSSLVRLTGTKRCFEVDTGGSVARVSEGASRIFFEVDTPIRSRVKAPRTTIRKTFQTPPPPIPSRGIQEIASGTLPERESSPGGLYAAMVASGVMCE
ncbi:hypothetical protein QYE76_029102 [Lolium multiflorum]|uniref:Pre-mRNA-splicing helicase BRR2-like plug domain-containing protein n=1 Tax=Lolium multiflorum TaxID=4521 RepID=A0AAD8QQH5_LOLMU|nr:hypothetical protein QYE76_029102 [Lolium multiflorum]